MNLQSGVFLDVSSVDRGDLDLAALKSTLPAWQFISHTSPPEVATRIAKAQVVIANKAPLSQQALEQAKDLLLICVAATGTNNVNLQAAVQRGVTVCNVRDYATASVVQHVFTLILNLSTKFLSYHDAVLAASGTCWPVKSRCSFTS